MTDRFHLSASAHEPDPVPARASASVAILVTAFTLAAIGGLYAQTTSGSYGLVLCATLALLSGTTAVMMWISVFTAQPDLPHAPDSDENDGGGGGDPWPGAPPDGAEFDWEALEHEFRVYASRERRQGRQRAGAGA